MALDLSEPRKARRGIGLTSLIDVIFILIIFFMLVSSFERFRVVDLAGPSGSTSGAHSDQSLSLTLTAEGDLKAPAGQNVEDIVQQAAESGRAVSILVSQEAIVQNGVDALDFLHSRGVNSVSLIPGGANEAR